MKSITACCSPPRWIFAIVLVFPKEPVSAGYTIRNVIEVRTGGLFPGFDRRPAINGHGVITFAATLTDGRNSIWMCGGGPPVPLVLSGQNGFSGAGFGYEHPTTVNDAGLAAIRGGSPELPGRLIIALADGGTVTKINNDNMWESEVQGHTGPSINNRGEVTLPDIVQTSPAGPGYQVLNRVTASGATTRIAATGGTGRQFSAFSATSTALNNSGLTAFIGTHITQGYGVYAGDGTVLRQIAQGGAQTYSFSDVISINDAGSVAFYGFTGSSSNKKQGIYVANGSGEPVLYAGQVPVFRSVDYLGFSINSSGSVAFTASLLNPIGNGSGLFVGPDPVLHQVVPPRGALFGSTLIRINCGNRSLNDHGQIVFSYELADGRLGYAIATPETYTPPAPPSLNLASLTFDNSGIARLAGNGAPGRYHLIQSSDSPSLPFTTIGSVSTQPDGFFEFFDPNPQGSRRFYRLLLP